MALVVIPNIFNLTTLFNIIKSYGINSVLGVMSTKDKVDFFLSIDFQLLFYYNFNFFDSIEQGEE